MSNKTVKPMEEIYANDSVCHISDVNERGFSSSKKRLYVGVIISLGILSVGLIIGLIRLGVHSHALSSSAAGLSDTKVNLTDRLQVSNDQLSVLTKARDQLNANLTKMSNEVTRLQSELKKKKTCPAGWRMFRGSCYILSTTTGSWDNARADCRSRGGDLVVINDDDEQKFVLTFSEKSPWIGLKEETEGSWKWVDGTPLSSELKKYWGQGQPDNAGGGEACAQIWENYKTWNDNKCDDSFLWICEKAPEC
ncbi:PREDICTED: CD209 antigen-like protein E isoform X2 [Poecilia mexicana]|uniref:CD209 antigen-like protein E isoform X2 n=1 Tax=Poecilia mexicana TaxID=48701 RepID=UPI00072DBF21|nr:PREDICTED: CD209 antigen-like protein E isoform X2 [Poecilia mexicana]